MKRGLSTKLDGLTRALLGEVDFALERSKAAPDTSRRIDWLRSVFPREPSQIVQVLDAGCGYGFFVDALTALGCEATGIDVGSDRLTLARGNLSGSFIEGEVDEEFVATHRNQFHVVTLFHVLEHLRDPVAFLRNCSSLLAPGGLLQIEVPNLGDEFLTQQRAYRDFYWQLGHVSYFDNARLSLALYRAGAKEFTVRGVQRYGLRNLLNWLDQGRPQLIAPDYHVKGGPLLVRLEELYRRERERALACDTLIVEVKK